MIKTTLYTYLGENGTITSPIKLDLYSIKKYKLQAENKKRLTKDGENFYYSVVVPESDIDNWSEV